MAIIINNVERTYSKILQNFNEQYSKPFKLGPINLNLDDNCNLGILGSNGSGKTTLLRTIVGTLKPDSGSIFVPEKILPLIYVGRYFLPDLTVKENLRISSLLSKQRMLSDKKIDELLEFAEIPGRKDMQVKRLSKGMRSKIAVSLSLFLDFDLLIIDETLDAGDAIFTHKLREEFSKRTNNKSLIICSHNIDRLKELCSHGLYLRHGKQEFFGTIDDAVEKYEIEIAERKKLSELDDEFKENINNSLKVPSENIDNTKINFSLNEESCWFDFKKTGMQILKSDDGNIEILDCDNTEFLGNFKSNEEIDFIVKIKIKKDLKKPIFIHLNLHYYDINGKWVNSIGSIMTDQGIQKKGIFTIIVTLPKNVLSGKYYSASFGANEHEPFKKIARTTTLKYFSVDPSFGQKNSSFPHNYISGDINGYFIKASQEIISDN